LASQCLKNGVVIRRGIALHINDASLMHHTGKLADLVVNCTGLGATVLGGVVDKSMYPARGQTVLVRNDPQIMACTSGCDDNPDEVTYIMQRAGGGGCILGGCLQKNSWEAEPDLELAKRIMKRCIKICPTLTNGGGVEKLSIVRHGVGLRPMRNGGIRIEREVIDRIPVVHNYGHGGYGYQTSYGCARAAANLVDTTLKWKTKL
jgi:D-amino-acid oxidase